MPLSMNLVMNLQQNPQPTTASQSQTMENFSLADLTQALQGLRSTPHSSVKPPQYNGLGDLELFLLQFNDVAKVNKWSNQEHLLHLRLSLTDKAMDYSRGTTVTEVQDMLKVRFGLNSRQAREKMCHLKKTSKQFMSWKWRCNK